MAALMLFAIESHSNSQRAWANQALARTATGRMFIFQMIRTVLAKATLAFGGGGSASSR
jgi:hypothetical protein